MNIDSYGKSLLSNEQKLLILASRVTFDEGTINQMRELVSKKINWSEFIKYASYHRVVTLAWINLQKYGRFFDMPRYINDMIKCAYIALRERNRALLHELKTVEDKLDAEGILYIPVKGALFQNRIYKDLGLRYTGDYDLLIKEEDTGRVREVMHSLCYYEGFFQNSTKTIEKPSRKEVIQWMMYGTHMMPFKKLIPQEEVGVCIFDFRFAFEEPYNNSAIKEMIDSYSTNDRIEPAHIFTHLCVHFYTEANLDITRESGKDLNIIKLCDIREYFIQEMKEHDISRLIRFLRKYNLTKPVIFTLCILNIIYSDGYESGLLSLIISDSYSDGEANDCNRLIQQDNRYLIKFWDNFFSGYNV